MKDSIHRQETYELGRHLWSLKNLAVQTRTAAQRAEQNSRAMGNISLAQKMLDIQRQLCVLQLTLKDPEIQEWTGNSDANTILMDE